MNIICKTYDTRLRLKLCKGIHHNHSFCFRKCGSIGGTKETITPFTKIEELYNIEYIKQCNIKNLKITEYPTEHVNILMGEYPDKSYLPVGFIIY